MIAGPYGTMLLGDLGAEVIKVEEPGRGDLSRKSPPHIIKGESAYYLSLNRNKKSITLNLKDPEQLQIFYSLVEKSDVVFDNFRPGVPEKLKISYESLKRINSKIISCSITGFGLTGDLKDSPAFDLIIQARGGIMSFTGERGRMPVRIGIPIGDLAGAIFANQAVLAALYQRQITGQGQKIDISLLDCQISLLTYRAQYYFLANEIPMPIGTEHASLVPIKAFSTKTIPIVIDAHQDHFFSELCSIIGRRDLIKDPRCLNQKARLENKDFVHNEIQKVLLEKPGEKWLRVFAGKVPSAPINTIDRAISDPQIISRNMIVETDHPLLGKIKLIGNPMKMSSIEKEGFAPPPLLGEHTMELLTSLIGLSEEKVKQIIQRQGGENEENN
jgi:CoA:oxalate CoA-transferase